MKARWFAFFLVVGVLPSAAQSAGGDACRAAIEQKIAELGVTPEEIQSTNIVEKTTGGQQGKKIVGWIGWMRPVGIKGYLVIEVNKACGIANVYTRGDFQLEGVKHY